MPAAAQQDQAACCSTKGRHRRRWRAAQHHPGEFFSVRQRGRNTGTRGARAEPLTCTPARTLMLGRSARMSSEGLLYGPLKRSTRFHVQHLAQAR